MPASPSSQRPSVSIANTRLGRYWIERPLGAGSLGQVYAAFDPVLGRRTAVEVLRPELSSHPLLARALDEARAATTIADPGLAPIFDVGTHVDGSTFIVMEQIDGVSLDRRLRRAGVLSVRDALRLVRQVATTLGALHARGIVHGALKAENIFMARDPDMPTGERPKVVDFGIAALLAEPAQCSREVDARTDVYALGYVLFTLVTGVRPFDVSGSQFDEIAPLASSRHTGIPAGVDALIARCLAKRPDERFANGAALAAAIDGALATSGFDRDSTDPIGYRERNDTLSGSAGEVTTTRPGHSPGLVRALAIATGLAVAAAVGMGISVATAPEPTLDATPAAATQPARQATAEPIAKPLVLHALCDAGWLTDRTWVFGAWCASAR